MEKALARSETDYELYVSSDTNAAHRCQWFYFMVGNTRQNKTVRFSIVNLTKFPHFLKEGLKPLVFSETDNSESGFAWTSKTDRIQIYKTSSSALGPGEERQILLDCGPDSDGQFESVPSTAPEPSTYYTLSFSHTFSHDNDRVYFAFWKPYPYSRLRRFCFRMETTLMKEACSSLAKSSSFNSSETSKTFPSENTKSTKVETEIETREVSYRREQLCLSLGGVPVDLLTITASSRRVRDPSKRSYVVVTARVHAGETAGSYKAQGLIRFLLSKDPEAAALREEHIFLVLPMLNPEGVVMGNNRCSLAGCDLNRCWGNPSRVLQPTVHQFKKMLGEIGTGKGQQITVFCDLHGHSQKLNSFLFACPTPATSSMSSWTRVRLFPRIFAKRCHILNYQQCRFKVEPDKVQSHGSLR